MHHREVDSELEDAGSLAEVEEALKKVQATAAQLEVRIGGLLVPSLGHARQRAGDLRRHRDSLLSRLNACGGASVDCTDEIRKISRRELCEIKQFTKNPPDAIRRTIAAAWLLLHGERFVVNEPVRFDDVRDWPRCQKMLAQDGFIEKILRFDVQSLDELSHVVCHVAERYFGLPPEQRPARSGRCSQGDPDAPSLCSALQRASSDPTGSAHVLPILTSPDKSAPSAEARGPRRATAAAEPGPSAEGRGPRRATVGVGGGDLRSDARKRSSAGGLAPPSRSGSKDPPAPKLLLDEQTVGNACKPMGALARWMLELIRGHVDRDRLRACLGEAEAELLEVDTSVGQLESDETAAQEELRRARAEEARLVAWLQQLRASREAATRALKDMQRLEAMVAAPAGRSARPQLQPGKARGSRAMLFQEGTALSPASGAARAVVEGAALGVAPGMARTGASSRSCSPAGIVSRRPASGTTASRLACFAGLALGRGDFGAGAGSVARAAAAAEEDALRRGAAEPFRSATDVDGGSEAGRASPVPSSPTSCRTATRPRRPRDPRLVMTGVLAKTERFDGRSDTLSLALPCTS